jgi:eukaryotic-like serine/threonine-protein kinase
MERLVANYKAIIEAKTIYYPVAYRFVRELGRGRQGIVFLCLRQGARGCITRHAIKLFDPGIYSTAKKYWNDMGRIASQISRLQTVQVPNLVDRDVYEEAEGVGYVQMAAIDGLDLQDLIYGRHFDQARRRSTPEEWARFSDVIFRFEEGKVRIQPGVALYIMRSALRGLEALHDAGFVHCDVKPANIMVDQLGYVKMVDYGRGGLVNEPVSFLLGSPLYMAPEIHRRERYLVQSDLYSLGLVGLELLRGQALVDYSRMTERELLAFKTEKLPDQLTTLLPAHVRRNEEFVSVLRKLLHPDPAQRYPSAQEAETGTLGLALLHKQLTMLGKDSQYDRDLESYLVKLYPQHTAVPEMEAVLA